MKQAIVTGATGFVGRHLVEELVANGTEVIAIVRDENKARMPKFVRLVECAMGDYAQLPQRIGNIGGDCVFYHLAWDGTAGEKRADVELQLANVSYTVDAIKAAIRIGCEGFVGAGSLMEYEVTSTVYDEATVPGRANIYSTAKLAAHYMARIEAQQDIRFVWVYITNAYGEDEVSPRFLNTLVRSLQRGEAMRLSSCTQHYDFIHVSDVARAFCLAGLSGVHGRTYCIGSGASRSLKEYVIAARDMINPGYELVFGETAGISIDQTWFDSGLLRADTGFEAKVKFEDGIRSMCE